MMADACTLPPGLKDRVVRPGELGSQCRDAMFALFAQYYANVTRTMFEADLDAKDLVILLDGDSGIAGFSTASWEDCLIGGRPVTVVFSGDTIVDRAHWGEQALAKAWLREMGRLSRACGGSELVWLLIVKGHRTYRYLPAFARRFVPARSPAGDDTDLLGMRNALAHQRFGGSFDPATGIVRFASPRGNLDPAWAEPSERERQLPDVRFFLEANPGFRSGDELACLCSLARENMKPLAQRWFDAGLHEE